MAAQPDYAKLPDDAVAAVNMDENIDKSDMLERSDPSGMAAESREARPPGEQDAYMGVLKLRLIGLGWLGSLLPLRVAQTDQSNKPVTQFTASLTRLVGQEVHASYIWALLNAYA